MASETGVVQRGMLRAAEGGPVMGEMAMQDDEARADDLPASSTMPWGFRRRRLADLGRFPFRSGICATLAVLTGLGSLQVRDALAPPDWLVIGLVALAVLPWLVDLLVAIPPPWAFAPTVLVPVAILHDPALLDPLPFLLAILALDMGLQVGAARSAPIVVASVALVTWQAAGAAGGAGRSLPGVLGSIAGGWLVGLALHSQVRRVARLRRSHRDLDELLRGRLEMVRAELAAVRSQLERGEAAGLQERLVVVEHQATALLHDLEERANGGSSVRQSARHR
jgi:hypothetical protein